MHSVHISNSARPAAFIICAKYILAIVSNDEFMPVCVCVFSCFHTLESILLILLLKHAQFLLDPVQQVGALEAAAPPVTTHHDDAEAAHQHRGPIQVELLRHHLATRCPIAARQTSRAVKSRLFKVMQLSFQAQVCVLVETNCVNLCHIFCNSFLN